MSRRWLPSLDEALAAMPDPWATAQVDAYEAELAVRFGVDHAVAVSSGTGALHTALVAAGIGVGDEVLVPAASVVMSVAPIIYTGATPVFVDSTAAGPGLDLDDVDAKVTERTRAVLPVHLWGQVGNIAAICDVARDRGLLVIEDACQAAGTRVGGQLAGTIGDVGCLSTKDGKVLWSGEGGAILTHDPALAERCRALRSHWQAPPPGGRPMAELGHNYRLAEPLAALARHNLERFDDLLAHRRHQSGLLARLVGGAPGLTVRDEPAGEAWNWHTPLLDLHLNDPRGFCARVADAGIPNSAGSYGLVAADQRPLFAAHASAPCEHAAAYIDHTLAVVIADGDDDDDINDMATTITREAHRWQAP